MSTDGKRIPSAGGRSFPADMPDATPVYVVGYGEATVGLIRATRRSEVSAWEADLRALELIATERLCRGAA